MDKNFLETSLFPKLDLYFGPRLFKVFLLSLALLALFGVLLFDVRISNGGDDSSYLMQAMKYSRGIDFPSFHGIFYILLIGWFIKLIGFKLIFFKTLSLLFLCGNQVFLYLAFRKKISPFLLSIILLLIPVSSGILYFGSQTYTEAFFMLLQALFLFYFITIIYEFPNNAHHLAKSWKHYILFGFILFIMSKTRSIGIAALLAALIMLFLKKKWIPGSFVAASFLIANLPYLIYKKIIWGIAGSDSASQMSILMQKDPYNPSFGYENFWGLILRLIENSKIYLSNIYLQELGLKKLSNDGSGYMLTLVLIVLLIFALMKSYQQKQPVLLLLTVYLSLSLGGTFVALNQMWSQSRLLIIYVPLLFMTMVWAIVQINKLGQLNIYLRYICLTLIGIIILSNSARTLAKVKSHHPVLKRSMQGDRYYGYTPDMANFLKISEWAAEHVPPEQAIGSRKPGMSFVYGKGRFFHPIYKLRFISTDSVLALAENYPGKYIFIDDMQIATANQAAVTEMRRFMKAIVTFDEAVYSMFLVPADKSQHIDSLLEKTPQIHSIQSIETFREQVVDKYEQTTSILPDELLNELYANHVHYLINASLRAHEGDKTGATLNTVERWMIAISSKYPNAFVKMKQIGKNNNEPASLYRINYEYCKLMGWIAE